MAGARPSARAEGVQEEVGAVLVNGTCQSEAEGDNVYKSATLLLEYGGDGC